MSNDLEFEKPIADIEKRIQELKNFAKEKKVDFTKEIGELEKRARELKKEVFTGLSAWQRTQLARHIKRPTTLDYIGMICSEFIELHGGCEANFRAELVRVYLEREERLVRNGQGDLAHGLDKEIS